LSDTQRLSQTTFGIQVKTFLASPYLTAPANPWSGSAQVPDYKKARNHKTIFIKERLPSVWNGTVALLFFKLITCLQN